MTSGRSAAPISPARPKPRHARPACRCIGGIRRLMVILAIGPDVRAGSPLPGGRADLDGGSTRRSGEIRPRRGDHSADFLLRSQCLRCERAIPRRSRARLAGARSRSALDQYILGRRHGSFFGQGRAGSAGRLGAVGEISQSPIGIRLARPKALLRRRPKAVSERGRLPCAQERGFGASFAAPAAPALGWGAAFPNGLRACPEKLADFSDQNRLQLFDLEHLLLARGVNLSGTAL